MRTASWTQFKTDDEDPRRHVYRASTTPATSPATAMHPRSLMPRHNRDDIFFAGSSRMPIAHDMHDIRNTGAHPAQAPPPSFFYPAHMSASFQQAPPQPSPPPLPPKPLLPASSSLVHRPSMFFQRPRTNTSPPPLPPRPSMPRPITPPRLDPSLTFSKPFPRVETAPPQQPTSSHRQTDSSDEKNLALAIALSQSEEGSKENARDNVSAQEDDDLAKALEASLKEAELNSRVAQEELNSTVTAWLTEGSSMSPGPSQPRGLPTTPPVATPPVQRSPQVIHSNLPDQTLPSAPPPDPPPSQVHQTNKNPLPVNAGESFIDLSFTPNIDTDEELAYRLAVEEELPRPGSQSPPSLPPSPFSRKEESASSSISGTELPRYTSRIIRPPLNPQGDGPLSRGSGASISTILVDKKSPRIKRKSRDGPPTHSASRSSSPPAVPAERTPPPYNEPLPSSSSPSVSHQPDTALVGSSASGHRSAGSVSVISDVPSGAVSVITHRTRTESRAEVPGLLAPPRNFARTRASSFSDISEGESPVAESSQNSANQGVLNMNAFVEKELFIGVTVGFTAPKISPQLVPMPDVMPNIISLPYGRCPPLHLQGPSWKHLLKLMAKLIGTRLEPTIEALAVNKRELKLRTVVQVIKPHQASADWRTILYFTTDQPSPQPKSFENVNELPYSFTLSSIPTLLRDGPDTPISKFFTIPASQSVPFPTLPITFPSLASYLHAALEESRRYINDSSSANRKLARMLETCYKSDFEDNQPASPERRGMGGLFKRVMGRNNGNTRPRRGGNEDTYELVTPFVQDEWG